MNANLGDVPMELISLRKARGRRGISTTDGALAYEILGAVSVFLGDLAVVPVHDIVT